MKNIIFTILGMLTTTLILAQAPQAFNYQGVARDLTGNPLPNKVIGVQVSILQGSATGTEVYKETHTVTTTDLGLFSLQIGTGTVVNLGLSEVDWTRGKHFLQIEIDENGGSNYQLIGTSELLSVPYALYAENTKSIYSFSDTTIYNKEILTQDPQFNSLEIKNTAGVTNSSVGVLFDVINSNKASNKAGIYAIATEDYPDFANGDAADLTFLTEEFQNRLVERMRITSAGHVGIGTSNPIRNFVIEANDETSVGLSLSQTGIEGETYSIVSTNTTSPFGGGKFLIYHDSSNEPLLNRLRFSITKNGNIGIGTSEPKSKLSISEGDVFIEDINKGVIMKSPNGQCWRMTVNNSGQPEFNSITCPQ